MCVYKMYGKPPSNAHCGSRDKGRGREAVNHGESGYLIAPLAGDDAHKEAADMCCAEPAGWKAVEWQIG
jgi:cytochrome c